jgi:hypothetical protein
MQKDKKTSQTGGFFIPPPSPLPRRGDGEHHGLIPPKESEKGKGKGKGRGKGKKRGF